MTVQQTEPTRKQKFNAALALAGMSQQDWIAEHENWTYEHVHRVLIGERDGSAELNGAIDAFIAKHLPERAD